MAQPPPFSQPTSAILVNLCWFLSLNFNLACATSATLVQQWAPRYLRYTQSQQHNPRTQARIHVLFFHSVDKLFIKRVVSLLPCFLHLSAFLFIIGLLIFLFNLNLIIFGVIFSLFGFSLLLYMFLTLLPLFQRGSLLYTPLSTVPLSLSTVLVCFSLMPRSRFNYQVWGIFDQAFEDIAVKAEEVASKPSSKVDLYVLDWILNALGEDDAVQEFFEAVPELFRHCHTNHAGIQGKLKQMLRGFLGRTFDSNTVTEDVRNSRLIVCLNASHAALGPGETSRLFDNILNGKWPQLLKSVETGYSLGQEQP